MIDFRSLIWTLILVICIYYRVQIRNWCYIAKNTFIRDFGGLILFLKTKLLVRKYRSTNATVGSVFRSVVKRHPNKTAIIWDEGEWTFKQLDDFSNRVAHFLKDAGIPLGSDIALMMEGRPEYIGFWLGASKVGLVTALINTNLKQAPLLHSITGVETKALIFTSSMAEQVKEILPELLKKKPGIKLFIYGSKADAESVQINDPLITETTTTTTTASNEEQIVSNNNNNNINSSHVRNMVNAINGMSNGNGIHHHNSHTNNNNNNNQIQSTRNSGINCVYLTVMNEDTLSDFSPDLPVSKMLGSFTDKLFYVYTSGTTGLPKAAIIRHARFMFLGTGANNLVGLKGDSVIYVPIPLYHMAGGAIGSCQLLLFGNTLALRSKFSASKFWSDCIRWNCTAAQYIGEICRYLLVQPEREADRGHNVKVMFGNGLRPNIWREFKTRFNIKLIAEFYGATEGNANVVNYTGKEGACGFVSQILPRSIVNFIYPVSIIKVNEETGEPVRDSRGLCIPCGPGETGEFVGKIIKEDPTRSFDGYVNKEATEKKIYQDVFKKGDIVFSSGDLLWIDDLGFVYFKDRTGDTFRWKGENVSTTEVETVIMNQIKLSDVVVYGVPIHGCEGRAGMAAICDPSLNTDKLVNMFAHLDQSLPRFAIPAFIRVVEKMEATGTFKLPKVALQKEAYDPNVISDPLFYLDLKSNSYQPLSQDRYPDILNGSIRF